MMSDKPDDSHICRRAMFERMQSLFLVQVSAPEATLANLLGPAPPRGGTQDSERITGISITLVRPGSVA
jgi:hypothetical protein